jgi:hypothetical protein
MKDITGFLAVMMFFLTVIGIWGGYIFTRHRERTMMIQKGLGAEDIKALYTRSFQQVNPLISLKWGLVLIGIGIGVILAIWLRDVYGYNEGVYPGMIALFGGVGLLLFYLFARKRATV